MHNLLPRRHMLAGGALAAVILAGFASAASAGERDLAVVISGFAFAPAQLTVAAGTRVVWTNRDDIPHTVTSAATPRLFGSEALDTGGQFTRVFDKPGTYRYYCALHPHMQGTVVVR